jgi:glutathione-regulated potassium-efflux system ancillary protein KefF
MDLSRVQDGARDGDDAAAVLIVYAHPHPGRSIANRLLLDAVRDLDGLRVRSLYDLYPDFSIDVEAERALLEKARLVVWQHPLYWYSVPALLQLWFEEVLGRGWAYGDGRRALAGKDCLWVATTGGSADAYTEAGEHGHPFRAFIPPVEQTARFCGMHWLEPLITHGAHVQDARAPRARGAEYRARLQRYLDGHG